jgi:hypothetical protein
VPDKEGQMANHDIPINHYERTSHYTIDTRDLKPDVFEDYSTTDWRKLTWKDVGRPYKVDKWAESKKKWEEENGQHLPVKEGWKFFNYHFHQLFIKDITSSKRENRNKLLKSLLKLNIPGTWETLQEQLQLTIWNKVHRVEDAIWDPRGKRSLFKDLNVKKPRILFLGAADGYEAMQLAAIYPGAEVVLVDYDDFCKNDRFGKFPSAYPFLGIDDSTGHHKVWYKEDMHIDFVVDDIRNLKYGKEFDIVVSIGLIEHFPDEYKPDAFEFHRRFLKPGGYAIMTTPRNQLRSRAFYNIMSDYMNYGYRELMDIRQMGLYAHENGFQILRAGFIKAHNGLICTQR